MNTELNEKLVQLAFNRSIPFCYGCYHECPAGRCEKCGSDDLMRLAHGVGCEFGTEWIIKHILESELEPVDIEEQFEESIRDCYPETIKVGWMEFDTVTIMKENDPVSWRCALSEYESNEEADGIIASFDGGLTYYMVADIENLIIK